MFSTAATKYTTPVFKKNQPDDQYKIQSLPGPIGQYPYHLNLIDFIPGIENDQIVLHLAGDTGSIRDLSFQHLVVREMKAQFNAIAPKQQPKFLLHLGDLVYNFGEASQYYDQFFNPYRDYPAPIFAVAGNHDADVNPNSALPYQSLDAFIAVFCDTQPRQTPLSRDIKRKSMVQPNIYWTMQTPLANVICLYSNVPKYGYISDEQRTWFVDELKSHNLERPGKALMIAAHHAPYSADVNHGSSLYMIGFLEGVFEETGIRPDLVLSGHVHCYQRFEKSNRSGINTTYIVAGAGGYDELHAVALTDNDGCFNDSPIFDGVTLKNYCDDRHGFLKMTLTKKRAGVEVKGEYYSVAHNAQSAAGQQANLTDSFFVNTKGG